MDRSDETALIAAARTAAANAHAPYSGFGVGAAVLLADGSIVPGCNFENMSYGLTLCAETVALGTVTAQGKLDQVRTIAVIGGTIVGSMITGPEPVMPCGRCRQVIHEAAGVAGTDIKIVCVSGDGKAIKRFAIAELLPHAFVFDKADRAQK